MTDRELLVQAAKVSGELTPSWYDSSAYIDGMLSRWNPLTNDGDAFRLAVKLSFVVSNRHEQVLVEDNSGNKTWQAYEDGDELAATRRAIVRAAAEVGKGMLTHDEFVLMFPGRFDENEIDRAAAEIGLQKSQNAL